MTNAQTTIVGSLALIIVLGVFGSWLLVFATPNATDIDAKRQPPQPLPTVSMQALSQQLAGREIKGSLPINLNDAALGRQDPFANQ